MKSFKQFIFESSQSIEMYHGSPVGKIVDGKHVQDLRGGNDGRRIKGDVNKIFSPSNASEYKKGLSDGINNKHKTK